MIEFTKSFATSDGKIFANINQAKKEEILLELYGNSGVSAPDLAKEMAEMIVAKSDTIVDILTTTSTSKVKARAIHGGRKPRKTKSDTASIPA